MVTNSLAFVFPGQGSQSVGMLSDLAETYPDIKLTFQQASDALERDLWALAQEGPAEQLGLTQNTQPLVLTAGVALWRVWQSQSSIVPAFMSGHSLGEYTALVCGDSLDFIEAVKLVERRASFMQQAVPPGEGAMAAILGLDIEQLINICVQSAQGDVVAAVNYNAPGQVVIAGNTAAVERAIEAAKAAGAKRALPLPVSVPSHCDLMRPAAEQLASAMSAIEFKLPTATVFHNTDVTSHQQGDEIKQALTEQLYTPVRWTETIQKLAVNNVTCVVECGPGKVLTGLNKRIDKSLELHSMGDEKSFNKTLEAFT
ncbi:MAG: [acyl-carrier-protein] S-malonyltransferase [Piscirickettsiaceae bacterium]|nr:MAG: [acyl-carrier-protein] S-malonyltransferase [Piscirickettsiaceae bacterium]